MWYPQNLPAAILVPGPKFPGGQKANKTKTKCYWQFFQVNVPQWTNSSPVKFCCTAKQKTHHTKIWFGNIFVAFFSRLCFIHFMTDQSSAETLKTKQEYELFASKYGIWICHYHCNNGHFSDNTFKQHVKQQQQTLAFCGINTHFQNSIAEWSIQDLTKSVRKQQLHARTRWLKCIHLALWPCHENCISCVS